MNTPALNEVLREYIDDGGDEDVYRDALQELEELLEIYFSVKRLLKVIYEKISAVYKED